MFLVCFCFVLYNWWDRERENYPFHPPVTKCAGRTPPTSTLRPATANRDPSSVCSIWQTDAVTHQNSIYEGTTVEWGSHHTDSIESFPECYNQSFTLRNTVPRLRDQDQNINLWTPTNEWMRITRYFSAACIRGLRVRVCGEQTIITLYFGIVWIKNRKTTTKNSLRNK